MTAKIFDTIAQSLVNSMPGIEEVEGRIVALRLEGKERMEQAASLEQTLAVELRSAGVLCHALDEAGVAWDDYPGLAYFCRTAPLRAGEGLAVDYIQPGRTDRT